MKIVILGAFQDELTQIYPLFSNLHEIMVSKARCLVGKWGEDDIYLTLSGIGTNAAAITTTMLCESLQPDIVIFCGVAGGLKSGQKIGDIVVANQVLDADLLLLPDLLKDSPYKNALNDPHALQPITTSYPVHSSLLNLMNTLSFKGLSQGIVVTSNAFPAPANLFEEIKSLQCSAIEMESAGIYKAAAYFNVPVLTLRAISNLLDESGNDLGTTPDALEVCSQRLADCLVHVLNTKI
jgi:adenosylhomocysteine nucleosidase